MQFCASPTRPVFSSFCFGSLESQAAREGVTCCFLDISQASRDSVYVGGGDGSKLLAKLFGLSSKYGRTSPTTVTRAKAEAEAGTDESDGGDEIRVCVNRTCRRQGSMQTLEILSGIAPPNVSVKSCGCLGRCGAGPNLVVLPQATFFAHCGTPARAAHTMFILFGGHPDSWTNSLAALAFRKRAEDEFPNNNNNNNASEAELLLSQAINLKPAGGIHVLYKDRSAARLVLGNISEALEDAKEALTLAPKYPEAYICQGDALMALDQFDAAEKSYAMAVDLDPSIYHSKKFKARIAKLQEKLIAADLP